MAFWFKPGPGSKKALKKGCICPQVDNVFGKGRGGDGKKYGWIVRTDCPLHGKKSK